MKLVFVHGWSFDARFWSPVHEALSHPDSVFLDRGYTGAPETLTLPDAPYLAITHSAGTTDLLARDLAGCRGIVAFNSFARFTRSDDFPEGLPPRILSRMANRLSDDPAGVVTQFRQQFEPFLPCTTLAPDRLQAGLDALIAADARAEARRWGASLTTISGTNDPLVTPAMTQAGFPLAKTMQREGGHLLPLTDPEGCAAIIRDWLEQGA
ncbi:alpha/beta fold hydrolase [Asaia sp. As-1742]|uniref:alpha/beta fold hydrolase n=1 Tax=Asaia sp. As-1742 TaxID=2608325 RepID=UPI0014246203|nr:biotin synthase [Asaia sp. As-1742]NIE80133.1 biotin synthase [Asaia sp. As-1742]